MEIIPLVLDEKMADTLPMVLLAKLADCSTDRVCVKVVEYLKSEQADKEIQSKVRIAYGEVLAEEEFLKNPNLVADVELLRELQYGDISVHLSNEMLEKYQLAISKIVGSDYAIPYIAPIRGTLIKDLQREVKALADETSQEDIKELYKKLVKFAILFRDSQHKRNKGTIVKKILLDREKYEIILRGIEFTLAMKKDNKDPDSWRFL